MRAREELGKRKVASARRVFVCRFSERVERGAERRIVLPVLFTQAEEADEHLHAAVRATIVRLGPEAKELAVGRVEKVLETLM